MKSGGGAVRYKKGYVFSVSKRRYIHNIIHDKLVLSSSVLWREVPFQLAFELEKQAEMEGDSPCKRDQNEGQEYPRYWEGRSLTF